MKKRIIALLSLVSMAMPVMAADVLIYDYRSDYYGQPSQDGALGLAGRQTAAGNNPITIDISGSFNTFTPPSLSNYAQVWDLGANMGINANQQSAYLSYLQGGGTLFLMGENVGFGATRNAALTSFIGTTLGGGSLSVTSASGQETVGVAFQLANSSSVVEFAASAKFQSVGTGVCITSNCSAVAWGVGTLANATRGTVISVLDVNFLQPNYLSVTTPGSPGYGNQDFVDNLIAYLIQQAQIANNPGPSTADTQASMTPNAYALRGAYSLQSAIINTGLSYDCTTFDKNGICVSAGGRVTDTNNPSTNSQGALLIASYRANDQWRIGAYLDQNLSSNDARGVNLDNSNPMGGLFAVWNQNTDGTGYQVRLAAGYSDKDVTISRSAYGATGEAGKGDSSLQSQAYSATISRGIQINDSRWVASPYLGVRYTKIKRAGYTEDSSADVTTPLTYAGLSQETTTALAGVRFNGQLGDKINLMASAGLENDIAHNTGDYVATGVADLTPIAFNQNIRHIRPVASAGASYAIDKRQTVGANVNFRQEAFNSTNSVSGMVTYQVGF